MAHYLLQLSYSSPAWAALIQHPHNRVEAVRNSVEKLGGKITGFWLSFGEHDLVGILEMPDNVSAAAFSMAITAGGACRDVKTTPLMSIDDGIEAMRKAAACGYTPATGRQ